MLYSDEVWTGVEYQVAAHMIYEGMVEEGLAIAKGARDRYDGLPRAPIPRSPWNEIECGGHYARAGSSWTLLLALSGWLYDGTTGALELKPRTTPGAFRSFFTAPEGWGSVSQARRGRSQRTALHVVEGRLVVKSVWLGPAAPSAKVRATLGRQSIAAPLLTVNGVTQVVFQDAITIPAGRTLTIALS
jgi:hypothetical protein